MMPHKEKDYQFSPFKSEGGYTFNQLIHNLKVEAPRAPSKSWFYNALGLYFDDWDLTKLKNEGDKKGIEAFHTYGKLAVSHKVKLLTVDNITKKMELIKEIDKEGLTVRQLQERIVEGRKSKPRKVKPKFMSPHREQMLSVR